MDKTIQIPSIEECAKKVGESWYQTRYPEFVDLLNRTYSENYAFKEKIYLYLNNLTERPVCKICGKPVTFKNVECGYREYCCSKCIQQDSLIREKTKNTLIEKYGTDKYSNREKYKQTCLKRYGVENTFAHDKCKDKIKQTMIERYGVEYAQQSKKIQETRKQNSLKKYGVDHHMKHEEIRKRQIKGLLQRFTDNIDGLIGYTEDGDRIMACPHPECNLCTKKFYIIPSKNYYARKEFNIEPCTNIHEIKQGRNRGTILETTIRNILDEYDIEYETNNRSILKDKELDIYIPSKNIAIECNGCFWHSQQHHKPINYHIDKYKKCRDVGVQLIMFWEDQIKNNLDIVKSILLSKLGLIENKIGARQCNVKEIDSKTCCEFLKHNHIQGKTNAKVHLGLYHKDELVAVMTFTGKSGIWDLNRFCNKLNTSVIGGASKLLKYFIKTYSPSQIKSYSSNDISNGNLYESLGFIKDNKITSSYWYIHKNKLIRYHRSNFSKQRLEKMGYNMTNKSESDIMNTLPYWKIYDSGHVKYILEL